MRCRYSRDLGGEIASRRKRKPPPMATTSRLARAAERGVDVRIAWAEPVSEPATHQRRAPSPATRPSSRNVRRRRSRRSTPGRTASARSRRTARNRGRPLPAVADQIVDAERAGAVRMRADRLRIPAHEVEVRRARGSANASAPRISALAALGRAKRRAMEFGLGRQPQSPPARERVRLGPRHVDRPVSGQRHALEHAAPEPAIAVALPEGRMRDARPPATHAQSSGRHHRRSR